MTVEYIQSPPDEHWECELLAVLICADHRPTPGVRWLTEGREPLQLATMRHSAGHVIAAHGHPVCPRQVRQTQEVLLIRRGILRADFYDRLCRLVTSHFLHAGDVLLLVGGGHGFLVVQDVEMVEVKLGPHMTGEKVRF